MKVMFTKYEKNESEKLLSKINAHWFNEFKIIHNWE